jgi:hypothetical protein
MSRETLAWILKWSAVGFIALLGFALWCIASGFWR